MPSSEKLTRKDLVVILTWGKLAQSDADTTWSKNEREAFDKIKRMIRGHIEVDTRVGTEIRDDSWL